MPDEPWEDVMWGCERWLSSRRPTSAADTLRAAARALGEHARPDRYGEGASVADFEREMAVLLGKQAAALFPSGTMAQQIALRLHCDQRATSTVAWHATSHLELHEHAGYAHLHGLKPELIGDRDRLIELGDLEALRCELGAVLLELPQREIGGQLPEWEALIEQTDWVRARGAALHLDGARIWEAAPYYGRSHAEIAGLFDTVYVSLYKGLLGLAGSVLAGPGELIEQAKVWRRRHGGTLPALYPFAAAARRGLDELVPQMPRFLEHARRLAEALRDLPGVTVLPDPPQTPMFHLHLRGDRDAIFKRALDLARERRIWLFGPPKPGLGADTCKLELNIGEPALELSPSEVAEQFAIVLGSASA
ncbi:MAG: threonine aldolase family protein [Solirubrobacteraceae bacterium]